MAGGTMGREEDGVTFIGTLCLVGIASFALYC